MNEIKFNQYPWFLVTGNFDFSSACNELIISKVDVLVVIVLQDYLRPSMFDVVVTFLFGVCEFEVLQLCMSHAEAFWRRKRVNIIFQRERTTEKRDTRRKFRKKDKHRNVLWNYPNVKERKISSVIGLQQLQIVITFIKL